ncbi:hypothetical protein [Legionella brunensis]|uniref:Uncharacterized protein n=1 Tax=Legionella brunensis TaxID=29422 RepID=A0A0W0SSV5_9GAMM|nr:hypothetical protein [Legionella brunensis]KTC86440.1 hypothetical protein Lbru_0381 [Legionella brunensis]
MAKTTYTTGSAQKGEIKVKSIENDTPPRTTEKLREIVKNNPHRLTLGWENLGDQGTKQLATELSNNLTLEELFFTIKQYH